IVADARTTPDEDLAPFSALRGAEPMASIRCEPAGIEVDRKNATENDPLLSARKAGRPPECMSTAMTPPWRGAKPRPTTVSLWPACTAWGEIERLGDEGCAASRRITSGKSRKGRRVAAQSPTSRGSVLGRVAGQVLLGWPEDEVMLVPLRSRSLLQVELRGY